jgi:hypothetical protein
MNRDLAQHGLTAFLLVDAILLAMAATGHDFGHGPMSVKVLAWNFFFLLLAAVETIIQRGLARSARSDSDESTVQGSTDASQDQAAQQLFQTMGLLLLYLAVAGIGYEIAFTPYEAQIHIPFVIVGAHIGFMSGRSKMKTTALR